MGSFYEKSEVVLFLWLIWMSCIRICLGTNALRNFLYNFAVHHNRSNSSDPGLHVEMVWFVNHGHEFGFIDMSQLTNMQNRKLWLKPEVCY